MTAAAPEFVVKFTDSPDERESVFRLRYEIYVDEMNMFASVADHTPRRLLDSHDECSELLIAYADGEPVGTVRLTFGSQGEFSQEFLDTYGMGSFFAVVPREAMVVATRFVVRKRFRGSMLPFELIAETARVCAQRGIELAFCDCQPHLINLYSRLGFRPYRRTYNDPHMALMVPLVMFVRDGDNLRRVGSPLLGLVLDPKLPTSALTRRALALLPHTPPVRSLERVEDYDWSQEIEDGLIEQSLRVFDGLDGDQLSEIVAHSHIIDLAAGDYVIRKGQVTRTMYVLLGGELDYRDGSKHIGNAQIGEAVGDIAFLLRRPRTLDVIAGPAGARVLSLNEPALRTVMESRSQTAAIVLLNLCRMLAERVAVGR